MNVLMQLRKVCNHPNLFEPRPTLSPFVCAEPLEGTRVPKMVERALGYEPLEKVDLRTHPLNLTEQEFRLSAFDAFNLRR